MGGKSGGGLSIRDLAALERRAEEKLTAGASSGVPHVFISFAYEDLAEVNLLRGQAKNPKNDLEFDDYSVKEPYESKNADYIKRQIAEKISKSSVTMVYLTASSASSKWVEWEIQESIKQGKKIVGVYSGDAPPAVLPPSLSSTKYQVIKWEHDALVTAIQQSGVKR